MSTLTAKLGSFKNISAATASSAPTTSAAPSPGVGCSRIRRQTARGRPRCRAVPADHRSAFLFWFLSINCRLFGAGQVLAPLLVIMCTWSIAILVMMVASRSRALFHDWSVRRWLANLTLNANPVASFYSNLLFAITVWYGFAPFSFSSIPLLFPSTVSLAVHFAVRLPDYFCQFRCNNCFSDSQHSQFFNTLIYCSALHRSLVRNRASIKQYFCVKSMCQ